MERERQRRSGKEKERRVYNNGERAREGERDKDVVAATVAASTVAVGAAAAAAVVAAPLYP